MARLATWLGLLWLAAGAVGSAGPGPSLLRLRARLEPTGIDPDARGGLRFVVQRDGGDDVLVADLGGGIAGSGLVRCCYDDGGGSECNDESTERECLEYGGRSLGPGTCLPDPCGGAAQTPIPCCEGDDEAAVCSLETPSDCSLLDGVALDAESCDPDPCASRPPGAGEIRCCIPPRRILGLPTCTHLTDAGCAEEDGVSIGPGSCSANPCLTSASSAFVESPVRAAAVAGMPHRSAASAPRPR